MAEATAGPGGAARGAPTAGPRNILFVCTGNICRSPMAWGVFRRRAARAGAAQDFCVDAAGLRSHHVGHGADPRAAAAARRRGYDLAPHRARQIGPDDFARNHLIVGMGDWHVDRLRSLGWAGGAELCSLMEYAADPAPEVPDPYRGGSADFEHALDLIEAGCAGLLEALLAEREGRPVRRP